MKTKVNYLNNKDLLEEIHKSKNSYCSYTKDTYSTYDLIVNKIDAINIRTVAQAKRNKAKRQNAFCQNKSCHRRNAKHVWSPS